MTDKKSLKYSYTQGVYYSLYDEKVCDVRGVHLDNDFYFLYDYLDKDAMPPLKSMDGRMWIQLVDKLKTHDYIPINIKLADKLSFLSGVLDCLGSLGKSEVVIKTTDPELIRMLITLSINPTVGENSIEIDYEDVQLLIDSGLYSNIHDYSKLKPSKNKNDVVIEDIVYVNKSRTVIFDPAINICLNGIITKFENV